MKIKQNFWGLVQIVTQKYYNIVRKPYNINTELFESLKSKHFGREFKSKYSPNLFVDSDQNSATNCINEIKFNEAYFFSFKNELRILRDWINDFVKFYEELRGYLDANDIQINEDSKQYKALEYLKNISQKFLDTIEFNDNLTSESSSNLSKIKELNKFKESLEIISYDVFRFNDYTGENKFLETNPEEVYPVEIVFRRYSQICRQINILNNLIKRQFNQVKVVYGNAGIGKSNFSVHIYSELLKEKYPAILIAGKSFSGSPDDFDKILMKQLLVPDNYFLEEVLENLNNYGKKLNKRVVLIFDGLNETTFGNQGYSKIWSKNLINFIESLNPYPYLFLITTLRTSYIQRIWKDKKIPYPKIELKGFKKEKLFELVRLYFNEYKINYLEIREIDVKYFSTPLYLDLYCKMLNADKIDNISPELGLNGFKNVFEKYIENLTFEVTSKLNPINANQVKIGISSVSEKMLVTNKDYVSVSDFFHLMEGGNVISRDDTIGYEVLNGYLIYLEDFLEKENIIIHTQQEVGGYLLSKCLIETNDYDIDKVLKSDIFQNNIIGEIHHQLKDDILKFLLTSANEDSEIYNLDEDIITQFTLLNLQREQKSDKNNIIAKRIIDKGLSDDLLGQVVIENIYNYVEEDANINFDFIKKCLIKKDQPSIDIIWTNHIYEAYSYFNSFIDELQGEIDNLSVNESGFCLDLFIWLTESTIRNFRDKVTSGLISYFFKYPEEIITKLKEYNETSYYYIKERLALVAYGVTLRLQHDNDFINKVLPELSQYLYEYQFSAAPINPTYNYIIIDSYKHIIDLAIHYQKIKLSDKQKTDLCNYRFNYENWFELKQADKDIVEVARNWHLHDNPDPLRGDFVHYTIPRLVENDIERTDLTANIYKEILNLGYGKIPSNFKSSDLYKGVQQYYFDDGKVDRLGKKYSWIAYFNYAGYLLNRGELDVWSDEAVSRYYVRLGDVDFEISYDKDSIINRKIIDFDFLSNRSERDWTLKTNYDILNDIWQNDTHTLLSSFIDCRGDDNYKVRSWLQVKSYFVDKDELIKHIDDIQGRNFDWNQDFYDSGSLSKVYFGELYWADSIPNLNKEKVFLPLDVYKKVKRIVRYQDVLRGDFNKEDIGKEIIQEEPEYINLTIQQTLIDYLWESDSKISKTLSKEIPSPNLARKLDLKVKSDTTEILDSDLVKCYEQYSYEEDLKSQKFNYFKTELLEKYLEETNQLLIYQVKQFSYDNLLNSPHFRGMQFFVSKLNR